MYCLILICEEEQERKRMEEMRRPLIIITEPVVVQQPFPVMRLPPPRPPIPSNQNVATYSTMDIVTNQYIPGLSLPAKVVDVQPSPSAPTVPDRPVYTSPRTVLATIDDQPPPYSSVDPIKGVNSVN